MKGKRIVSILLAVSMVAMLLGACGGNNASSAAAPESAASSEAAAPAESAAEAPAGQNTAAGSDGPICKIGMISYNTGDATITPMYKTIENALAAWNVEVVYASADMSDSEATITAMETLINQGVDGIVHFAMMEESANLVISKMCQEAGVYLVILDGDALTKSENFPALQNNPYLVALCGADTKARGYQVVELLAEAGCKNIGLLFPPEGMSTYGERQTGAKEAAEALGLTIVNVQEDIMQLVSPSTGYDATSSMLASYPEIDGIAIGIMTQMCISGVAKAAQEAGSVKVAGIDFDENTFSLMEGENVAGFNAVPFGQFYYAVVALVNACTGNPLSDELMVITIPSKNYASTEEAADYYKIWDGGNGYAYTDEEMMQMLKIYNPDFTADDLYAIVADSFNYAAELEKR